MDQPFKALPDDEFDKLMMQAMEREAATGAGARAAEEYFAGPYRVEWHRVWNEGRAAHDLGKSRDDNPHRLKVWRAVWGYGWDNYDPNAMPAEFARVEEHLKALPTRPMTEADLWMLE